MKNITRLSEFNDLIIDNSSGSVDNSEFKLFTVDHQNNVVYFITQSNQLIVYSTVTKKVSIKIELNEQDILSENAQLIAIQFIPDLDAVCMASNKGDIIMYSVSNGEIECVGIIGSGITCMSWSPDYELFILATESETLIQMTKDWEMINEVSINSYLPGKPKITNINSNSNGANNNTTISTNNKQPIITWRGDGQYFACSSYESDIDSIQLRVWERSLQLHSMNESIMVGLENQISWRPSGSLIAISQRLEQTRHDISFFERNGLKHGEFTIRSACVIQRMEWSSDSEILALQMKLVDSGKSVVQLWHRSNYYWFLKQEIQCGDNEIITMMQWDLSSSVLRILTDIGRYNEYRFCWDYDVSTGFGSDNPTTAVMVDGNSLKLTPFRRLVVPPPMSACSIELPNGANSSGFSFNRTTHQIAVLTSLDNSILVYTPATLPPIPMAPNSIKPLGTIPVSPEIKATLPNYSIAPTLTYTVKLDGTAHCQLYRIRHFHWLNSTTFIGVESKTNQNSDNIVEITINPTTHAVEHVYRTPMPSNKILRIASHLESLDQVLFETVDGYLYIYSSSNSSSVGNGGGNLEEPTCITPFIQNENIFKFPTPCPWFSSCTINQEDSVVGLNERNKLYVNQFLLCTDCNSYALHNKFLLFTTVSHVLRSVSLLAPPPTSPLIHVPVSSAQPNSNYIGHKSQALQQQSNYDDSIREIERGSRIVAVVPHDTRLVLQMPRGNLEAIAPRSLTLSTIREQISNHRYLDAFMSMRRNRIDMNFLYDHNPVDFIRHIELFVEQIHQIDYLNLFISSLRDEDTTKTLFVDLETKHTLPITNVKPSSIVEGKVNLVCDSLRKVFVEKNSIKYNLPILTTYVKKSPPELDQVLRLIQSLRGEEVNEQGETIVNRLAEESLDYIVFLVDVDKLYDIALGTYDFELVIMVAQKSQKDPKEYISFLQALSKMEKYYQRYSIDKHLSRWELALYNLSRAGSKYQQDCLDLIVENKIYKFALENFGTTEQDALIQEKEEMFKKVKIIYADHLLASNSHEDSAYLYLSAGEIKKAISSFKDAGCWEMAISQAKKAGYTIEQQEQLVVELTEILKRNSKLDIAAKLLSRFPGQLLNSISVYCEGYYFNEALLLLDELEQSIGKEKKDELEALVTKSIQDSINSQSVEIDSNFEKYQKMSTRIVIVRTNKLNYQPLLLPKGQMDLETGSMMSGMSGMFSEGGASVNSAMSNVTTSSYVSTYSQQTGTYSTATKTRLKKKENKKQKPPKVRLSGKEGSPYEEDYLVEQMKKLIPSAAQQESIGRIIKSLVLFNRFDDARKLTNKFQQYLDLIDSSLVALSASASAILPENKKEKEREYKLLQEQFEEQQHQLLLQQQSSNIGGQPIPTTPVTPNKLVTLVNKQIVVSRDKSNWNLNIF